MSIALLIETLYFCNGKKTQLFVKPDEQKNYLWFCHGEKRIYETEAF